MNFAYHGPKTPSPTLVLELLDRQQGFIGIDIETISLDDQTPIGLSFATSPHDSFYFPIDSPILPWDKLRNPAISKIVHNGHFDLGVIKKSKGIDVTNVTDTIVAAQLLGYQPSLFYLYDLLFGEKLIPIEDLIGKKGKNQLTMDKVPEAKVAEKCCLDSKAAYRVWERLEPEVPMKAFDLEMRLQPILMAMEDWGIRIDVARLIQHRVKVKKDVDYYKNIASGLGFNPGSSKQLAAVLQSRGWHIHYNKKTKNPILDDEAIQTLYYDDPIAQMASLYRKAKILLSTFIDATLNKHIKADGRIHGRINQIVTNSGRLSRSKPNLQNIPERMRDIFIPSEGRIFEDWDLEQIELRKLAYLVWQTMGDRTMQELFDRGGKDSDIHGACSVEMDCERRVSKGIHFSITYGGDENTLQRKLGIPLDHAISYIDRYFARFPGIKAYISYSIRQLYKTGYTETMLGRKRLFPDIESPYEWKRKAAEREAFNHIIQGSAAEDLKELQTRIATEPQCNTIHDEILLDISPDHVTDKSTCIGLASHATPMKVERGLNWKDLIEVAKVGWHGDLQEAGQRASGA